MKWKKYTIETTTAAEDFMSSMLMDLGIEGIEIEDNIPLTKEDQADMFIDFLPELPPDEGISHVSFYIEDDGSDQSDILRKVKLGLEDLRDTVDVGSGVDVAGAAVGAAVGTGVGVTSAVSFDDFPQPAIPSAVTAVSTIKSFLYFIMITSRLQFYAKNVFPTKYPSTRIPRMILYQPNTLKSCFLIYPIRNLMARTDTTKDTTTPTIRMISSVELKAKPNLTSFRRLAPNITGIAR